MTEAGQHGLAFSQATLIYRVVVDARERAGQDDKAETVPAPELA